MIALATWLHAASSCVWLVSEMLGDNVGVKEARQVRWMNLVCWWCPFCTQVFLAQILMDEEAVLQMMQKDLDVLSNEEENSKLRLRLAIGAQILVGLSSECTMQNKQNALSSDLNKIRRSWSWICAGKD